MNRVVTRSELYTEINRLRSRMVEWYFKKEAVWTKEEWLDPSDFNKIIADIIQNPPVVFDTEEGVMQYKLSEGIE